MSSERREHERFELIAQVELAFGGPIEKFVTINISAGGLLLRNDHDLKILVGESIRVSFDAPQIAPAFSIDAKIVRIVAPTNKPGLIAAMWKSTDAKANEALSQILWNLRKQ